jgi:hypothetical protein
MDLSRDLTRMRARFTHHLSFFQTERTLTPTAKVRALKPPASHSAFWELIRLALVSAVPEFCHRAGVLSLYGANI